MNLINLIPTKKLALLSAAVCAGMLAFSHNANALAINDEFALGTVNPPLPLMLREPLLLTI
jgi:hypothetical protein